MGFEVKCIPVLDRMPCCCCSCNLRTAAVILGWLYFVEEVVGLVTSIARLAIIHDEEIDIPHELESAMIAGLVLFSVALVIVGLLLYGVHKERSVFMLPFLILNMIGIITFAVSVVVIGIIICVQNVFGGLAIIIIGGLSVALSSFFWVVIYSYYRKLEEDRSSSSMSTL